MDSHKRTYLVTVQSFHAEMKLTEAAEASQQKPSIIGKEDSDFVFYMRLFSGATHDVAWDVNWMFRFWWQEKKKKTLIKAFARIHVVLT